MLKSNTTHTPSTYWAFMRKHATGPASHNRFIYALEFSEYVQDNYGYNLRIYGRKCGTMLYGWDDDRKHIKTGPGFIIYVPLYGLGEPEEKCFPVKVSREYKETAFDRFARNLMLFRRFPDSLAIPGWKKEEENI